MAEGKPPYGDIHPMRAIFMIPQKPPPSFRHPDDWSTEFIDFVMLCLVKNPEERATATELLSHVYIKNAKPRSILKQIIEEACEAREAQRVGKSPSFIQAKCPDSSPLDGDKDEEQLMSGTIKEFPEDQGTLIPEKFNINNNQQEPSAPDYGTLVPDSGTMIELESNLGTMVINSDGEDTTLKSRDENAGGNGNAKYRPQFLDHFDRKNNPSDESGIEKSVDIQENLQPLNDPTSVEIVLSQIPQIQQQLPSYYENNHLNIALAQQQQQHQQQNQQHQMFQPQPPNQLPHQPYINIEQAPKYTHTKFVDEDFDKLKFLSFDELQKKLSVIDREMERDIEELTIKYNSKRKPILDAITAKRKRQNNINSNLIKI